MPDNNTTICLCSIQGEKSMNGTHFSNYSLWTNPLALSKKNTTRRDMIVHHYRQQNTMCARLRYTVTNVTSQQYVMNNTTPALPHNSMIETDREKHCGLTCITKCWSIYRLAMFGWKSGDSRNRRKNSYTNWKRHKHLMLWHKPLQFMSDKIIEICHVRLEIPCMSVSNEHIAVFWKWNFYFGIHFEIACLPFNRVLPASNMRPTVMVSRAESIVL